MALQRYLKRIKCFCCYHHIISDLHTDLSLFVISRHAEGPGQEILQRPVRLSICVHVSYIMCLFVSPMIPCVSFLVCVSKHTNLKKKIHENMILWSFAPSSRSCTKYFWMSNSVRMSVKMSIYPILPAHWLYFSQSKLEWTPMMHCKATHVHGQ